MSKTRTFYIRSSFIYREREIDTALYTYTVNLYSHIYIYIGSWQHYNTRAAEKTKDSSTEEDTYHIGRDEISIAWRRSI